ncbi:hypothetical protein [Dactylosporangium sp. NPDC006015]|uniref:hypothetical protein n=1 Tax=Dactylosporangium sp. NPDC006015 TaxID=3154576 RepID=UPI0033B473A9
MTFDVDRWCRRHLGAPVAEVVFSGGHLSRVYGVRLADARAVVVKARAHSPRLDACTAVQRALWQAGFPAPEPLAGPVAEDGVAVTAEVLVPGGATAPLTEPARRFATLLARFVAVAPPPSTLGTLTPAPPWTAWDHEVPGIWPAADDRDDDLNAAPPTPWLDELGAHVRERLTRFAQTPAGRRLVTGHGDWEAQNLRWTGDDPLAVHDWDSVIAAPEAVVVGLAAAVWPCGMLPRAATVDETAAFLDEYQRASGRTWPPDELGASWAAGLWVSAYNTKKATLDGLPWLSQDEAARRLTLSGT